ncbi:hypothetical protein [Nocardia alni]|uniref:hypothetical protein n=1 Tax=Nocardia alni TaxID=2815723 RepID=UPI001C23C9AC|nr:hypothetical protein [Nocardia alni]
MADRTGSAVTEGAAAGRVALRRCVRHGVALRTGVPAACDHGLEVAESLSAAPIPTPGTAAATAASYGTSMATPGFGS